ncbi:MAG: dihydrofolate reductase [Candidatus Aenigmarchaeota archaeon]|nr:dihydrofolate reductase [Candidatus Aenigmarchaeota archaeon]
MKVILFMAMTINGIIARENDKEDFLSDRNWKQFCALAKDVGCFVIGRRTYEVVKSLYKDYNFDDIDADRIIVSANPNFDPGDGHIVANSPKDAVRKASSKGFRKIILTGGSTLNSAFIKAGLIDEIIVDIEPAILGKGVKIFAEADFYKRLKLKRIKKLPEGIIQLHYEVIKSRRRRQ